jgi:DNA-binding Xre family transcriptional regulator
MRVSSKGIVEQNLIKRIQFSTGAMLKLGGDEGRGVTFQNLERKIKWTFFPS